MQALNVKNLSPEIQEISASPNKISARNSQNKPSESNFAKLLKSAEDQINRENASVSVKKDSSKEDFAVNKKDSGLSDKSAQDSLNDEKNSVKTSSDVKKSENHRNLSEISSEEISLEVNSFVSYSIQPQEFENQTAYSLNSGIDFDASEISAVNAGSITEDNFSQENFELSSQQLSYLMSKSAAQESDFDNMIENAEAYLPEKNKASVIETMQNLSVEDPVEFLRQAEFASENISASEFSREDFSLFNQNGAKPQMEDVGSLKDSDHKENQNFFTVSLNDSSLKEEKLFEIKDLRSLEEKLKSIEKDGELNQKNSLDFTLNLTETAQNNIASLDNQSAGAEGSAFQQMFSQTISNNIPEFVKAGSIVLRDNNQGEINMNLRPESLGNVKLSLQVSDKVITGQITVHSKEAFEAFKQNLNDMKQAFVQNGFDEANISLVLADSGNASSFAQSDGNSAQQQTQEFLARQSYADYAYSSEDTAEIGAGASSYEQTKKYQINVVA